MTVSLTVPEILRLRMRSQFLTGGLAGRVPDAASSAGTARCRRRGHAGILHRAGVNAGDGHADDGPCVRLLGRSSRSAVRDGLEAELADLGRFQGAVLRANGPPSAPEPDGRVSRHERPPRG
jgi:hypothetical protein